MILCLLCLLEVKIISFLLVEKEAQHFLVQLEIRLLKDKEKIYKIYGDNFCFGMPPRMIMPKLGIKREIKKLFVAVTFQMHTFDSIWLIELFVISPMDAKDSFSFPFPQSSVQIETQLCLWLIIVSIFRNRVKRIYKSTLYT